MGWIDRQLGRAKLESEQLQRQGEIKDIKDKLSGLKSRVSAYSKLIGSMQPGEQKQLAKAAVRQMHSEIKALKKEVKKEERFVANLFKTKVFFGKTDEARRAKLPEQLKNWRTNLSEKDQKINELLKNYMVMHSMHTGKQKTSQTGLKLLNEYRDVTNTLNKLMSGGVQLLQKERGLSPEEAGNPQKVLGHVKVLENKLDDVKKHQDDMRQFLKHNPSFREDQKVGSLMNALENKNKELLLELGNVRIQCQNLLKGSPLLLKETNVSLKKQEKFNSVYNELTMTEKAYSKRVSDTLNLVSHFIKTDIFTDKEQQLLKDVHTLLVQMASNSQQMAKALESKSYGDINTIAYVFSPSNAQALVAPLANWGILHNRISSEILPKILKSMTEQQPLPEEQRTIPNELMPLGENFATLSGHFIDPVQRGPRWVLLTQELMNTAEDTPAYAPLLQANQNMKVGMTIVNLTKKIVEG